MNFFKRLSLYWDLVEIDLHDDVPVRERLGRPLKNFITDSDNKTLTNTARDIKNEDGKFKGVIRRNK